MSDRYGVPEPTGAWFFSIAALREAHEAMKNMKIDSHHGEDSLGNVFQRQIEAMIGSIDQHWRQAWMKTAMTPPKIVIPKEEFDAWWEKNDREPES